MTCEETITIEAPTGDRARDARLMRETLAYLVREEALHCLQVASLTASEVAESLYGATSWLVARRGEAVVGVGSITGGFNMLLSRLGEDDAVPALVEAFLAREFSIPGVMGNERDAVAFAAAWNARSGTRIVPGMRQAIMECRAVRPPLAVPGTGSWVREADQEWLLPWLQAFADEVDPDPHPEAGASILRSVQPPGGMAVWRDAAGEPVSIAGYKGWTMNGVRIGPVYTPPEHRGRGYGSAVTALATQALLDEGRGFTCLYTDLANPTSNHIYAGIGYEPVATSVVLRFV